jgi:hypothetical protein
MFPVGALYNRREAPAVGVLDVLDDVNALGIGLGSHTVHLWVSVWSDPVDDPRGRVFGIRTDFPKCPLILSGHFGKHWSGGFGGWLESISEIPGQQFFDPVDRMFGDADQDLTEISFRVHSVQLG